MFKERVWGGRRLTRWFPDLPPGPVGEAWVLSDHPQGRTPIANGPLRGETIHSLRRRFAEGGLGSGGTGAKWSDEALLGTRGVNPRTGEFPLLFKLLDAQDDLSIQVHPNDDFPGLPPGELGKSEMRVVLDAEPGARIVHGLAEGVGRGELAAAIREGRTMEAMRSVTVHPGDVYYVPAGTVHALGAGLLVAEIQQSSDTTYRLYDYDRLGLDGRPRELHVDQALACASYNPPPAPSRLGSDAQNRWETLVFSPYFITAHGRCSGEWIQETDPGTFEVLMILEGTGTITWSAGASERLAAGQTWLVPAALGRYQLAGEFSALRIRVP